MNIITCDTEILQAKDDSFWERKDRWYFLGWHFYTHYWKSQKT